MKYKEELINLTKTVKANTKANGGKLRNEDIAERMDMTRQHFQDLLREDGAEVNSNHIFLFKSKFVNELQGVQLPAKPKDPLNRERAYIKTLVQRFAAFESRVTGQDKKKILEEIERDTISYLRELEGQ